MTYGKIPPSGDNEDPGSRLLIVGQQDLPLLFDRATASNRGGFFWIIKFGSMSKAQTVSSPQMNVLTYQNQSA